MRMRSWLFAPGDSPRKMVKADASPADVVLFDLEDAVAEDVKPKARHQVAEFLQDAAPAARERLWVRINPLQGPHALADLAAVMPGRPGGIMLPKARGVADVEVLDHYLSAFEAASGTTRKTRVIALVTETAEGMFTTGTYAGAPRLAALTWGAEDLADAVGATDNRGPDGGYGFTYELARSLCLLGAAAAGVAPIETIHGDFRDPDGLRRRAGQVRRDGYRGMLAIHPDQVDVINAAFTPSPHELKAAQEVVDLFAAHPGVGALAHHGAMLDRPHLDRARALLANAQR
ncbi:HpcH/HpaI aldolase/citrate lyase family protein [Cryptosporangium phraense]|uniref:CoA ester lyase n=1 Tax=Cryptosporangium phraense TaxID=2593070 RepID=A0A545APU3_9ACTN|nr:CoA ester lyase [Cryptosporangium phraense]TQS43347.1 CoA ester lyase [Cryptosporangium phraense]